MRRLGVAVGGVCLLLLFLPATRPAAAAGTCGTQGNYFDGYDISPPSNQPAANRSSGTQAWITMEPAKLGGGLCGNPPNGNSSDFESEWEMITTFQGLGGYSQAGVFWSVGTPKYFFSQARQTGTSQFLTTIPGNTAVYGQPYVFASYYATSCSCILNYVNTQLISQTPFNPYTSWTQPFKNEWYGEVSYYGSDINGTALLPVHFTAMKQQLQSNRAWTTTFQYPAAAHNSTRGTYGPLSTCYDSGAATPCFNIWTN